MNFIKSVLVISAALVLSSTTIFAADAKKVAKKAENANANKSAMMTMNVDPAQSTLQWTGTKKVGSSHHGTVGIKGGYIDLSGKEIVGGRFDIDMNSIQNEDLKATPEDMNKLVGHLKSADFFDVKSYPVSTYVITSGKLNKNETYTITGKLTIKGKTEPLSFDAKIAMTDTSADAKAKFDIDRTKWGLKYGSGTFYKELGDKVINDPITFELKLVAKKK